MNVERFREHISPDHPENVRHLLKILSTMKVFVILWLFNYLNSLPRIYHYQFKLLVPTSVVHLTFTQEFRITLIKMIFHNYNKTY